MTNSMKISTKGMHAIVKAVLSDHWQTASIIAAQVDIPPDAIARRVAFYNAAGKWAMTPTAARSSIVSRTLYDFAKQGIVEKRLADGARKKMEYRLAQPKP